MVRINLINPWNLTDQHLIAEYNEILMLFGYVRKHPHTHFGDVPKSFRLGQGHILFFKNKLLYLKKRFEKIKKEMKRRGFKASREISFSRIDERLLNFWRPSKKDKKIIKKRLIEKINKKPGWYRYYGEKRNKKFFGELIGDAN